ncbi:MAG: hypothetical protein ACTSRU_09155, partial [Candidatus Hodarchaeales archaeon]
NFYSPSGNHLQISRKEKNEMLVMNRPLLDKYLLDIASTSGANIHFNTKAIDFKYYKGKRKEIAEVVAIRREKRKKAVKTSWQPSVVINTEGYKHKMSTLHGFRELDYHWRLPALQYELVDTPDLERDTVDLYHGSVAPGFFAWIIPTEENCSRVGLAVSRKFAFPVNCKTLLDRFINKHPLARKKLKGFKVVKRRGGQVTATGPRKTAVLGNMLLAGDAAGQVKATTGGGVNIGSYCAAIAGRRAADYILTGENDMSALNKYDSEWKKLFFTELQLMMLYRRIVGSMSDKLLDKLFLAAANSSFADKLRSGGNVDMHSKILIKAAVNPQLVKTAIGEFPSILLTALSSLLM